MRKLQPQSIILVGGEGTRLRPLTLKTPKPMLKVGGETIVDTQIKKLHTVDVSTIVLATSYKAKVFNQYFTANETHNVEIQHSYEQSPLGTGGAIRKAYDMLPDAHPDTPVIVWNGDIISTLDMNKMLKQFNKTKTDAMLYLTKVDNPYDYGLVETGRKNRIKNFIEKPNKGSKLKTDLINAGAYIFTRSIIEKFFPENTAISVEREIFPRMVKEAKMIAYPTGDYWMDVGTPIKLVKANIDHVALLNQKVPEGYYYKNNSLISHSAKIGENVKIVGSIIESKSVIGDEVKIVNSYIDTNVKIGEGSEIVESVIGERAHIGARNSISSMKIYNNASITEDSIKT